MATQRQRRVPHVAVHVDDFGRGISDVLEPVRRTRCATRAVDDEIGIEALRHVVLCQLHAAYAAAVADQPDDVDARLDRDVRQRARAPPQVLLDERPAGADDRSFDEVARPVAAGLVPATRVEVDRQASARGELLDEPGEEARDRARSSTEQRVGVAALGDRLPRFGAGGETVTLEDGDPVEVIAEHAGRGEATDARSDDDGVVSVLPLHGCLLGTVPRPIRPEARGRFAPEREPEATSGEHGGMEADTDAAVIAASITEPGRFGVLFDRHATVLFRYLVRRVGVDEADSLLGEVFRVAFEKRSTYDCGRPNARPWLYGIATNLLARHRRREARRIHATARLLSRQPPAGDPADEIVADLDARQLWPRVADAVAGLPEEERDALLLFVWEELSYEDIALALGVPVGTVRSRLNRARVSLRELRASIGRET